MCFCIGEYCEKFDMIVSNDFASFNKGTFFSNQQNSLKDFTKNAIYSTANTSPFKPSPIQNGNWLNLINVKFDQNNIDNANQTVITKFNLQGLSSIIITDVMYCISYYSDVFTFVTTEFENESNQNDIESLIENDLNSLWTTQDSNVIIFDITTDLVFTNPPSYTPTAIPTKAPTASPIIPPTNAPSTTPTQAPTTSPVNSTILSPTDTPSKPPSTTPTISPTISPIMNAAVILNPTPKGLILGISLGVGCTCISCLIIVFFLLYSKNKKDKELQRIKVKHAKITTYIQKQYIHTFLFTK